MDILIFACILLAFIALATGAILEIPKYNENIYSVDPIGISKFKKCLLPDKVNLRLVAQNITHHILPKEIQLHLKKNRRKFSEEYLISKLSGRITRSLNKIENKHVAIYNSINSDAHIIVECKKKSRSKLFINGILLYNQNEYAVRSIKKSPHMLSDHLYFVHIHKLKNEPVSHGYLTSDKSRIITIPDHPSHHSRRRHRRDVIEHVTSFTIDLLVIVDYSVYQMFYARSRGLSAKSRSENTKNEIRKYYAHVVNGIDLRYQNIDFKDFQLRVKSPAIIIIDTKEPNQWTQTMNDTSVNVDEGSSSLQIASSSSSSTAESSTKPYRQRLNADAALKGLRTWINETKGLPNHDHAVLFTGYDLFTTAKSNGKKVAHTSGLAFIGTLCEYGDSSSIVEEQGGFQSIGTAAHEIGHSLGALHDGENNTCMSENRYIMAASGFGPVPESKKHNPWHFSECSVEYFKHFVTLQLAEGNTCLLKSEEAVNNTQDRSGAVGKDINDTPVIKAVSVPDISSMPGVVYPPDEQCRLIWGNESYLCRGPEFGNASSICTALYCRDPSTVNDCVLHTAARGTSCGNKKWCIQGKCESSRDAPAQSDHCVLGDQPGIAFNGMTCEELVLQGPTYCYQEKVRSRCCHSCGLKWRPRKGCEYGDHTQGCLAWHCSHVFKTRDILSDCCGTCNAGELIVSETYNQQFANSTKNSDVANTNTDIKTMQGECVNHGSVDGVTCQEYVQSRGQFVCYSPTISYQCCKTCKSISDTSNYDCKFGDKAPDLCERMGNITKLTCTLYGVHCCGTCQKDELLSSGYSHYVFRPMIFIYLLIDFFNFLMFD